MTITRFKVFPGKNEDGVLDEFGYGDVMPIFDVQPFYIVKNDLVFLFVDEEDVMWTDKQNAFSMKIFQPLTYKASLVDKICGKVLAVFVKDDKNYRYYGDYEMIEPYVLISGVGKGISPDAPLEFRYIG